MLFGWRSGRGRGREPSTRWLAPAPSTRWHGAAVSPGTESEMGLAGRRPTEPARKRTVVDMTVKRLAVALGVGDVLARDAREDRARGGTEESDADDEEGRGGRARRMLRSVMPASPDNEDSGHEDEDEGQEADRDWPDARSEDTRDAEDERTDESE